MYIRNVIIWSQTQAILGDDDLCNSDWKLPICTGEEILECKHQNGDKYYCARTLLQNSSYPSLFWLALFNFHDVSHQASALIVMPHFMKSTNNTPCLSQSNSRHKVSNSFCECVWPHSVDWFFISVLIYKTQYVSSPVTILSKNLSSSSIVMQKEG